MDDLANQTIKFISSFSQGKTSKKSD